MQLVIFGAPGAGKGTQSKIISKKFNLLHLSTGDLLRAEVKANTELGKRAKVLLDQGKLVPDDIVGGMVEKALLENKDTNGYILDGYPRTLVQADFLNKIIKKDNLPKPKILYLTVDDKVIVDRLANRRQCSNCKSIVNLSELKQENVCPKCQSKNTLIRRDDDKEEVILNRMKIYRENTFPVLEALKKMNFEVNHVLGTNPIDTVTQNIVDIIKD